MSVVEERYRRLEKIVAEYRISRGVPAATERRSSFHPHTSPQPSMGHDHQNVQEIDSESPFLQAMRTLAEEVSLRIIEQNSDLVPYGQRYQSELHDPNLDDAVAWLRAGNFTVEQVREGVLGLLLPKRIKPRSGFGRRVSGAVLQAVLDIHYEYPQDGTDGSNT